MGFRLLMAATFAAGMVLSGIAAAQDRGQTYIFEAKDYGGSKKPAKAKETPKAAKAAKKADDKKELSAAELAKLKENTGELRSGDPVIRTSIFGRPLGPTDAAMLPETRALDNVLRKRQEKKTFKVKDEFVPQSVPFSGYKAGTIVIDTQKRYLYLVESFGSARRYAIAVGREGLEFKGKAKVGDKQEWPRWFPTKDMQEREPSKYGRYKDGMNGGPENPLGARAIYLYEGKKDTHVRIHGTNQPQTIGTNSSNGCFRMINDHVIDLYNRVKMGTDVVVL